MSAAVRGGFLWFPYLCFLDGNIFKPCSIDPLCTHFGHSDDGTLDGGLQIRALHSFHPLGSRSCLDSSVKGFRGE